MSWNVVLARKPLTESHMNWNKRHGPVSHFFCALLAYSLVSVHTLSCWRRRICSVKLLRKQIKCLLIERFNACLYVTTLYHIHSLQTDANWQAKLTHVNFVSLLWGLIGILGYFFTIICLANRLILSKMNGLVF